MFFPRVFTLLGWSYKMYAWSLFSSYFQRKSLSSRVFLIEHIPRDLQKSWLLLIWHFTSKNEVGKRSSHRAAKWILLQHHSISRRHREWTADNQTTRRDQSQKTDTEQNRWAPQQKTRRHKYIRATSIKNNEGTTGNLFPPTPSYSFLWFPGESAAKSNRWHSFTVITVAQCASFPSVPSLMCPVTVISWNLEPRVIHKVERTSFHGFQNIIRTWSLIISK